jgi:hypothetical protein
MGWRLGGWKARRLKKHKRFSFKLPSFPAFYLLTYNAFSKAAQRRLTASGAVFQHPVKR